MEELENFRQIGGNVLVNPWKEAKSQVISNARKKTSSADESSLGYKAV